MSTLYLIVVIFAVILLLTIFLAIFLSILKRKRQLVGSLDMALFLVMMPKYEQKADSQEQKDDKVMIGQMEQVYSNFLYSRKVGFFKKILYGPAKIAFEVASQTGGTDIEFYVAVPKNMETAFAKYVQGVYPHAQVEKVPQDYTIFEPGAHTAAAYLRLAEPAIFPINTYKALDKDPLSEMTNALSKIEPQEGAAIQIIIRPLSGQNWKRIGEKVISKIKEGKSVKAAFSEATRGGFLDFLAAFIDVLTGQSLKTMQKREEDLESKKLKGLDVDERTLQIIQTKIQKQVFEANIRLVTSAQSIDRANEILSHLEGAFGQFGATSTNNFDPEEMKGGKLKKFVYDFSFRNFKPFKRNILNIEELASIYHFPTQFTETPYVKSVKSVIAPPPSNLPSTCFNLLGKVGYRGQEQKIYFASKEDRRRHFYIIGQTGTGKTGLLREMIRQDIQNGEGVAVVDPHGELVDYTLAQIPKNRVEDVVLFEPSFLERPVGLNMLEYETPEQKDFAVQEMIAIFYKLFPPEIIGPMFEHYMRNAMLALMADQSNPGTLVEIPRIFTDPDFMQERLQGVQDPVVRSFWLKEWQQTTGSTRSDMLGYVVSKVGRFVENEMMRNIIGQSHSGFDLAKVMDEKKIFLANLSKGMTGEVNSNLLGLILVSKMQMAAMRRARISEEQRQDFYLYIDEFQNFTTDSVATILSEARKYKLNLIMAHQYIPQLTEQIRDAVLGNVGTIGAFRIGVNDAEYLEKQFEPEFSRFDLVNLDNFNLIVKIMIENKVSAPFKMQTYPPKVGNPAIVDPIKKLSRLKYGRPKQQVEAEISKRSKL